MVLSSGNPLVKAGYRIFGRVVPRLIPKSFITLYETSAIFLPYEAYFSFALLISLILSISVFALIFIISFLAHFPLILGVLIVIPVSTFIISFSATLAYPVLKSMYVKSKIDSELFLTANLLNIVSSSGTSFTDIIEQSIPMVTEKYTKLFLERMIRNVKMFGMGVEEALEELSRKIPSYNLVKILTGMNYAIDMSGDASSFLSAELEKLKDEKRRSLEKKITSLIFFGEIYISLLVVAPIIFIIIIATLSMLSKEFLGLPVAALMNLIVYIIVPFIAIFLGILLDSIIGGW